MTLVLRRRTAAAWIVWARSRADASGWPLVFFRPLWGSGFSERVDPGFHPWLLTIAAPRQETERGNNEMAVLLAFGIGCKQPQPVVTGTPIAAMNLRVLRLFETLVGGGRRS